jgi:hypothetical protein
MGRGCSAVLERNGTRRMNEVIRLFDAMKELAETLHTLAHSGPYEECTNPNCQQFRPKDDE